jgi:hypothetical protein
MQHCTVPDSEFGTLVWYVEQRLHLLTRQVADQRLVRLLHRNGMNATRLVEVLASGLGNPGQRLTVDDFNRVVLASYLDHKLKLSKTIWSF